MHAILQAEPCPCARLPKCGPLRVSLVAPGVPEFPITAAPCRLKRFQLTLTLRYICPSAPHSMRAGIGRSLTSRDASILSLRSCTLASEPCKRSRPCERCAWRVWSTGASACWKAVTVAAFSAAVDIPVCLRAPRHTQTVPWSLNRP